VFHVAVEAAGLMALALFVAAWGTMLNQEKFSVRPWPAKVAFLAMVFYGACGLGDLADSVLDVVGPSVPSHYIEYAVSVEGIPLRATYSDNVCVSVTDLDGKPVTAREEQPSQLGMNGVYLDDFSRYIGDSHGWAPPVPTPNYRNSDTYLTAVMDYENEYRKEQWYYINRQRSLIGYSILARKAVARFGQDGFEPAPAAPHPFLPQAIWEDDYGPRHVIYWDGASLQLVSLTGRKATALPPAGAGPVFGIGSAGALFGVARPDRIALYEPTGAPVTTIPYDRDVTRWGNLELGVNPAGDRFYLRYRPSLWIDEPTRQSMPSYLEELDRQGKVLRAWTLPPLPPRSIAVSCGDFLAQRLQSPAFFFGGIAYQKVGALLGSGRLAAVLAQRFGPDRALTREIAIDVAVLSLALAAATLFWARRVYFSWGRAAAWAVFVLVFNVAGFITFRLAADWPRMVRCPRCRRPRPIHEALCPHCAAPWPEPEFEGTEVFDGAPAMATAGEAA
jgi:hypothetical protein